MNVATLGTDVWASDWTPMSPQKQLDLVMSRLEQAGRGIVLFHDTKKQTADMLPAFLRELKKRGWRVAHLVPGPGRAETVAAGPGWRSETEGILARWAIGSGKTQPPPVRRAPVSAATEKMIRRQPAVSSKWLAQD
jgi:hypothetical protein